MLPSSQVIDVTNHVNVLIIPKAGLWCGIELDSAVGLHGGCVGGVEYFSSRENHGIFAPVRKVEPEDLEAALPGTHNQR